MDSPIDAAGTLVHWGGAVKALEGNRVAGYAVLFGGPDDADLSRLRDYFTPATDFGLHVTTKAAILYHHGVKPPIGGRELGVGELKADDVGIWIDGEMALRDEYERAIYEKVKEGKLGWSTGTASHRMDRKAVGGGVHEVLRWPLGLDCSLTPTPCDYRTQALSLKALIDSESVGTMDDQAEAVHTAVAAWKFRLDDIARMRTVQGKAPISDRWMAEIKSLRDELDQLLIRSVPRARPEDVCSLEASFIEIDARLSGIIGS
jgi:phage head maturation protease